MPRPRRLPASALHALDVLDRAVRDSASPAEQLGADVPAIPVPVFLSLTERLRGNNLYYEGADLILDYGVGKLKAPARARRRRRRSGVPWDGFAVFVKDAKR